MFQHSRAKRIARGKGGKEGAKVEKKALCTKIHTQTVINRYLSFCATQSSEAMSSLSQSGEGGVAAAIAAVLGLSIETRSLTKQVSSLPLPYLLPPLATYTTDHLIAAYHSITNSLFKQHHSRSFQNQAINRQNSP